MYVCMYVYAYIDAYIRIYIYICIHIHTYIHKYLFVSRYICIALTIERRTDQSCNRDSDEFILGGCPDPGVPQSLLCGSFQLVHVVA